jgi:DNA-nicking Smr family endonuclease
MRRVLTPNEAALWRRVSETARPLQGKTTPELPAPSETPKRDMTVKAAPRLTHLPRALPKASPPPADRGEEKRVRRGKLDIDARLDLHGLTQDRARVALLEFIVTERAGGARVVLAITGKSGVLRVRLGDWLAAPDFRVHLAGYAEAHRRHGGEGARYVFLKRRS